MKYGMKAYLLMPKETEYTSSTARKEKKYTLSTCSTNFVLVVILLSKHQDNSTQLLFHFRGYLHLLG